jgi:integrase
MARAGASRINQECSCLQQMLKRIGRWTLLAPDYQPLPVKKESPGRALSTREKALLYQAAMTKKGWETAYLYAVIAANTTAGPKEVFTLRLQDVDLEQRFITIQPEGAKNVGRIRPIPLNDLAFAAIERALVLAKQRGSVEPHHYIFAFRLKGNGFGGGTYDPERHCTTIKTAWRQLTKLAGIGRVRPYDLRHTAITEILQIGSVSEETAKSIAGHIDAKILKTYSHIRMEAKRAALDALVRKTSGSVQNQAESSHNSNKKQA